MEKSATTHWEDIDDLRAMFPRLAVKENTRWVDEGDHYISRYFCRYRYELTYHWTSYKSRFGYKDLPNNGVWLDWKHLSLFNFQYSYKYPIIVYLIDFSPAISMSLIKSLERYILPHPFAIVVNKVRCWWCKRRMFQSVAVRKWLRMHSNVFSSIASLALLKIETISSSLKQSKNWLIEIMSNPFGKLCGG